MRRMEAKKCRRERPARAAPPVSQHERDARAYIKKKAALWAAYGFSHQAYSVDSISNPQASSSGSGMYLEFLLRRAHSRSRVERKY